MKIATPSKKLKADDYLQEMAAQCEPWMKRLIEMVTLVRGTPDDSFLNGIYEEFLASQGLAEKKKETEDGEEKKRITVPKEAQEGNFTLSSLKHEEGVNLLRNGATIPFHDKLTVIYGKNGSGKSGFVRILKRVAGSRTQEEIWQNVHRSRTQNNCSAVVTYMSGGTAHPVPWHGESKVEPFDQLAIFDGKCIPFYLNKGIDFSYQPYGFELFPALSSSLQKLQEMLESDIEDAEEKKPEIDGLFDDDTTIGAFVSEIDSATKPEAIDALPEWTAERKKDLAKKLKRQRALFSIGHQAELLQTYSERLTALENALVHVQTDLSPQNVKIYLGLIKRFNALNKKLTVKKGKTLEDFDISEMESDEWQRFIEAAEKYIHRSQDGEYPKEDDHCIFCQQKLTKNSQKLILLYRELFKEEEVSDIDVVEEKIKGALSDLEYTSYAESFPYDAAHYKKLLSKKTTEDAFAALGAADTLAETIATCLKDRKEQKLQPAKIAGLIAKVRAAKAKVLANIVELEKTQKNLTRESQEVAAAIAELKDVQALSKHRPKLQKYVAAENWIAKASGTPKSKLNTKSITDLGNRAWRELVSESFKEKFRTEALGLDAPVVNLEFHGEYGSQIRQKNLAGLKDIDKFLSEGEQKAVSLADFFAELSMQEEKAPVIFDDPATSFDHERKKQIAARIVKESGERQVVVFTHDLMFASYIHRKIQNRSGEIDATKAAFHNLEAESGAAGVVTENYYIGKTKFDAALKKVEQKVVLVESLSGQEKADEMERAYSLLRQAVEKAVEERIFGGVITRWSEQIQLLNASKASLDKAKLTEAQQLHEDFSAFIESHDQSDEMTQHAIPSVAKLKEDIEKVRAIATTETTPPARTPVKAQS